MIQLKASYVQYHDSDGSPLDAGYVYFGESGANPETNPIQVYFDYEGTIPAAQPLRTNSGVIVRNGSPVRVYSPAVNYSCTVKDKSGNLVFSTLNFAPEAEDSAVETVTTYAALRAYSGLKTRVNVTGLLSGSVPQGIAGTFVYMAGDTTSADNGGTIIVDDSDRRWHRLVEDELNVRWFGAVGNGIAIDTAAFTAAKAVLETNSAYRGGTLYIPKGIYLLDAELNFTAYAAETTHNIYIRGDGGSSTFLNFASAPPGSNGISFNKGLHFGISGITVANAKVDGISLVGGALGSTDFLAMGYLRDVRVQFSGRDGIFSRNSFMITMDGVWSRNNTRNGITFAGFHTSINATRSWASENTNAGWNINGCCYSSFSTLGSDANEYGYAVSNCSGVDFISCGAELSDKESFILQTNDSSATGIPTECQNISAVSFQNCYALNGNNTGAAGAYSTFMGIVTANSRPINITVSGCRSIRKNVGDYAIAANGASGAIRIDETSPSYDADVVIVGTVYWSGRKLLFTPVLKGASSAGTATYSRQNGEYSLSSGLCKFRAEIAWTGHTGTGFFFMDGLPITSALSRDPSCLIDGDQVASTGVLGGYVEANSRVVRLSQTPLGGIRSLISVDAAGALWISGEYEYQ